MRRGRGTSAAPPFAKDEAVKVSPLTVLQLEKRERSMAEGLDEEVVKLE